MQDRKEENRNNRRDRKRFKQLYGMKVDNAGLKKFVRTVLRKKVVDK